MVNQNDIVKDILYKGSVAERRTLFAFNINETPTKIRKKFLLWTRYFFPKYFEDKDAPFHAQMDHNTILLYKGDISSYTNIAFRGGAKTARAKLFITFAICNDTDHSKKYIKYLTFENTNSKQAVTDIYNMLVSPRVASLYPEIFAKTKSKHEETMGSFTTTTGIKCIAGTVGTDQRGALQQEARPDLIIYDDFETRTTLRSARKTIAIWENMEEARTSLAKTGGSFYLCNYLSEQGNVHKLVMKENDFNYVQITPIIDKGVPTWDRYTVSDIDRMREEDEDFEGERLCKPSAGKDIMFDREVLEAMEARETVKVISDFRMYKEYDPSHRYAGGMDIAGGVGLDSSTSVFIDFDIFPAQVVAVYQSDTIKPDVFGDEIYREAEYFGNCLVAPEVNNHGHATVARLKQLEANIYSREGKQTKINDSIPRDYGWQTNAVTKGIMLNGLVKAINNGHLLLNDKNIIMEAMGYTRNDLMENIKDVRLTTRHFDLLIACAIAWQMKDHTEPPEEEEFEQFEEENLFDDIGL